MAAGKAARVSQAGRLGIPFIIMGGSIWLVQDRLEPGVWDSLPGAALATPLPLVAIALLLTCLSFWAIARYDRLAHRHLRTGIAEGRASLSGFAAIAIGQTVGFGILTGAAVRWRMLPQLGLGTALRLATLVSITFMLALGFLTALSCLLLPAPSWALPGALLAAVLLPFALLAISFAPLAAPLRHRIRVPSLRTCGAILGWAALDVTAAALALYCLISLPELSFAVFLPAFLLALGAAMLSGAPGGVGPFELVLLTLLSDVPATELVSAIIVFRLIYFALPALLGVALVFLPARAAPDAATCRTAPRPRAALPELGILAQNGGKIVEHDRGAFALWQTTQTATMLFDPLAGDVEPNLTQLKRHAATCNLLPALYKCGAQTAARARRSGWQVLRIAEDFVLDPTRYTIDDPARRGLRRKLRKAERAGVSVHRARTLPLAELAAIDAAWQAAHGGARGGSMGRFCPDYLNQQQVFLAYLGEQAVAFVSFHVTESGVCLDLVRHHDHLPDGTMHLLMHSAILAAQKDGLRHFSLAAVPSLPARLQKLSAISPQLDNPGLRQFKASFAPKRRPLYAAAPSLASLMAALGDIASEIHRPRPLSRSEPLHDEVEENDIALRLEV